MRLSVRLVSLFEKYGKADASGATVLPQGDTVRALAEYLGLPLDLVKIMTVNGRQANLETPLKEGDNVYFFPPAIGGG
jgi:sulfur carrier protein/molybdopterin synthase sulfur carrier subunit